MRVAYHGSYLPWFEVARTDLIRELGYPYSRLESEGVFMPVTEIQCRYVKPVRYDDQLTIVSFLLAQSGIRVQIGYELYCKEALSAEGFTRHAFTDANDKPTRPPKEFIACLQKAL